MHKKNSKNKTSFLNTLLLFLSFASFVWCLPAAQAYAPTSTQIGINVGGISYYNREVQFADAMKCSSPLQSESWAHPANTPTTLTLDNGGYFPGGNFTLLFNGSGQINSWADASETVTQSPQTLSVTPTPGNDPGFIFSIAQSSVTNPISNIQLLMPGTQGQTSAFYS